MQKLKNNIVKQLRFFLVSSKFMTFLAFLFGTVFVVNLVIYFLRHLFHF